jgi:hypothetical protein
MLNKVVVDKDIKWEFGSSGGSRQAKRRETVAAVRHHVTGFYISFSFGAFCSLLRL